MRKVPELRFDGFDGEWEEKKIDDLARFYSGGTPSSRNSTYYNGTIPFIRSGEIHSACTELFISEEGLLNSSAKMVDEGDLVYALYGATSGEADIIKMSGAINQAILAIKLYDNYNSVFVLNYLNKNKEIILNKYLQGGQGNLSAQIVRNLNIKIPFFGEQEKIGDLFKNIDALIEKQEDKVSKMEDFKKSMLQKMFP
uniref:restriction endonuclease subunit S n=1 Tax=Anaerococcus sp. TaxID=1872515 RepID=UPI0027BA5EDE